MLNPNTIRITRTLSNKLKYKISQDIMKLLDIRNINEDMILVFKDEDHKLSIRMCTKLENKGNKLSKLSVGIFTFQASVIDDMDIGDYVLNELIQDENYFYYTLKKA